MENVYLDYAATTPVKKEVVKHILKYYSNQFANPSSTHSFGVKNRDDILKARKIIASSVYANTNEIYFTSGGTESDNWAIRGIVSANKNRGNHIISTKIEHHAVLNTLKELEQTGVKVTYLDVNEFGEINLDELKNSINSETILVSIMFVNNEIGTIQNIKEIGKICRENDVYFHTDAVQAYGSFKIDVNELNIDLMSISSHKIYGPKGCGALYIRKNVNIDNLIFGGLQERGKRAGTENVPAIIGFAKASQLIYSEFEIRSKKLKLMSEYLKTKMLNEVKGTFLNSDINNRHYTIQNYTFDNILAEKLLISLDINGIAASSGSACNSGSILPSHVLLAIGKSEDSALSSIRFSIGEFTTKEEIDYVVSVLAKLVNKFN